MKNSIITFLFSVISFCCLAQTPFTEKTFNDIIKRFETDPKQYLSTETAPDFMFVGTGGYVSELKGFTALYDIYKPTSYVTSGTKIRQYGNTCVVTGRMKHSYTNIKTGAPRVIDELFTYTYVQNKGNWLYVSAQHSEAPNGEKPEEIVKQWVAEYNKDTKAFFIDKCTDDFIASNTNNGGKFFGKEFVKGLKEGQPADAEISDMKSFKSGDLAVVMGIMTWHHKQADGSDKPDKTVSTFVMQKKSDKWMYAGYHSSSMVQEKAEDELKQFVKEYNKDATAFFMDRCSDNFRYTNVEGKFSGKDALKSDKTHTSDSEVSDLKVFQNGNLAVFSGIHNWKDSGMKVVRKVAFTYTMQKMNGKWLFAGSHHTDVKE